MSKLCISTAATTQSAINNAPVQSWAAIDSFVTCPALVCISLARVPNPSKTIIGQLLPSSKITPSTVISWTFWKLADGDIGEYRLWVYTLFVLHLDSFSREACLVEVDYVGRIDVIFLQQHWNVMHGSNKDFNVCYLIPLGLLLFWRTEADELQVAMFEPGTEVSWTSRR